MKNIQYELFGGDSGIVRSINEVSYHYISIPLKLEYKKYLSDKFSLVLETEYIMHICSKQTQYSYRRWSIVDIWFRGI